jgi:hypothetical protein
MERSETRRARVLGTAAIVAIWSFAAYLIVHYSLLLTIGPDHLHAALGDAWYNAVFPMGGFNVVLLGLMLALAWGTPFSVAAALSIGGAHLLWRGGASRAKRWIGVVAGLAFTVALPFVLFDGWPGPLYALPFGDDTEFAPGYSVSSYWAVRPGMTTDEVVALLGPPLRRYPSRYDAAEERWYWTRSPHDSSYRVRGVVFKDGVVAHKQSEFYVD